jgi:hypothetical protein
MRSQRIGKQARLAPAPARLLRIPQHSVVAPSLCRRVAGCHDGALPEFLVRAPDPPVTYAHPARLILVLSLAPTIGLGIGRFAYALVLPDMRDSLHWSYSAAGFMNTINAAGYLAGALLASRLFRRFGWSATVHGGTLASAASRAVRDHRSFRRAQHGAPRCRVRRRCQFRRGRRGSPPGSPKSRPERASFLLSHSRPDRDSHDPLAIDA